MEIIKFDNDKLIEFYIENGLEFSENKGYFGIDVKSFAVLKNEKVIGAVSISTYKDVNYIEAIAVNKEERSQGLGMLLLKKALNELSLPIYTISKNDRFYLKNGFVYDDIDLIDTECKTCEEYLVKCFPRVVVLK